MFRMMRKSKARLRLLSKQGVARTQTTVLRVPLLLFHVLVDNANDASDVIVPKAYSEFQVARIGEFIKKRLVGMHLTNRAASVTTRTDTCSFSTALTLCNASY